MCCSHFSRCKPIASPFTVDRACFVCALQVGFWHAWPLGRLEVGTPLIQVFPTQSALQAGLACIATMGKKWPSGLFLYGSIQTFKTPIMASNWHFWTSRRFDINTTGQKRHCAPNTWRNDCFLHACTPARRTPARLQVGIVFLPDQTLSLPIITPENQHTKNILQKA